MPQTVALRCLMFYLYCISFTSLSCQRYMLLMKIGDLSSLAKFLPSGVFILRNFFHLPKISVLFHPFSPRFLIEYLFSFVWQSQSSHLSVYFCFAFLNLYNPSLSSFFMGLLYEKKKRIEGGLGENLWEIEEEVNLMCIYSTLELFTNSSFMFCVMLCLVRVD